MTHKRLFNKSKIRGRWYKINSNTTYRKFIEADRAFQEAASKQKAPKRSFPLGGMPIQQGRWAMIGPNTTIDYTLNQQKRLYYFFTPS